MANKIVYVIRENLDIYENHYYTAHCCETNIFGKIKKEYRLTKDKISGDLYNHDTLEEAADTIEKHKQRLLEDERKRAAAYSKIVKVIPA